MKQKIVLILCVALSLSCSEGEFDIPEFNFNAIDIETCGDLVLYKVNGQETLVIELKNPGEDFLKTVRDNETVSLSENGSNRITYRTLSGQPDNNYFCSNIPPKSPTVVDEWLGDGTFNISTTFSEDDEDKVDEPEDDNINTDGDPYPNHIDSDDDGDGINTVNEDVDKDGDPANDDTDGDGVPNYLDDDDDNDNVPSINESVTNDADEDGIPDYLDPDTTISNDPRPRSNSYTETYTSTITITGLKLTNTDGNIINRDVLDFGEKKVIETNQVTIE
ncbi:MAG: hypothetical protein CSA39_05315 [Flavobacteriales bacterium]|nr:MAG: hypothetical protein CR985_01485 [Flavobacteriales bacterium]PIE48908.1 MAG: hypothetical protein CSA39_05315 [Flavobacteriales bacterium]